MKQKPDYYNSVDAKYLFGNSFPKNDYFNDNLDQYYDEDDFYDYSLSLDQDLELEDLSYTHSHKASH